MNCTKCQQLLDQGAQFCGNCGQPVATAPAATAAQPAGSAPTPPVPTPAQPASVQQAPVATAPTPTPAPSQNPGSAPTPQTSPAPAAAEKQPIVAAGDFRGNGRAIGALVVAIMSLIGWLEPIVGLPLATIAIVLGFTALKSQHRTMAFSAIVMGVIGLLLSIGIFFLAFNNLNSENTSSHIKTNCFSIDVPADMRNTTDTIADKCILGLADVNFSQRLDVKVLRVRDLTADNLEAGAKADVQALLQEDKLQLISEEPATFAGKKAYKAVFKNGEETDVVYYLFNPDYSIDGVQMNLFVISFATLRADREALDLVEKSWQWR